MKNMKNLILMLIVISGTITIFGQGPLSGSTTNNVTSANTENQNNQTAYVANNNNRGVNNTSTPTIVGNGGTTNVTQTFGTESKLYTDYNSVTRGAFWSIRPEAKAIFQGGFPQGMIVKALDVDYFAKFAEGEYSSTNGNYIRIPAGTLTYYNTYTNTYHLAECGNTCEYLRPCVETLTKTEYVDRIVYQDRIIYQDRIVEVEKIVYMKQSPTASVNADGYNPNNISTLMVDGQQIEYHQGPDGSWWYRNKDQVKNWVKAAVAVVSVAAIIKWLIDKFGSKNNVYTTYAGGIPIVGGSNVIGTTTTTGGTLIGGSNTGN